MTRWIHSVDEDLHINIKFIESIEVDDLLNRLFITMCSGTVKSLFYDSKKEAIDVAKQIRQMCIDLEGGV